MQPLYVRIHAADNVGVVVNAEGVQAGAAFASGLTAAEGIPQSHKIALVDLEPGEAILRYGTPIGYANRKIRQGEWVREDSMRMPEAPALEDLPLSTAVPAELPPLEGMTFEGYRNPDGTVGTRNILGITTTVQCVAPTVDYAVTRIRAELLPKYPNVDDVVAVTHT